MSDNMNDDMMETEEHHETKSASKAQQLKLYVGNLSYNTTSEGLSDLFGKIADVTDAKVIKDRETDRSKGFGFVTIEFTSQSQKDEALELNGTTFDGRSIKVNVAEDKPKEARSFGGGDRGGDRGGYKPRSSGGDRGGFGGSRDSGDRGGRGRSY